MSDEILTQRDREEALMRELSVMLAECARPSLFQLAARSLLNYSTAWYIVARLERAGAVSVTRRRPPQPLVIVPARMEEGA